MRMRPASGRSKPAIMRRLVVLPHPDGPRSEKNSPLRTSSETSSTAATSSKRFAEAVERHGLRAFVHGPSSRSTHDRRSPSAASRSSRPRYWIESSPSAAAASRQPAASESTVCGTEPSARAFFDQPNDSLRPGPVALLDERPEVVVVPYARPDLVPEGRHLLERGIERPVERPLGALEPGREPCELRLERLDAPVLGVREGRPQQLLPRREVVVDERARHAGLERDVPDAERVRALRHDHAAGCAEDVVDAVGGRASRGCGRRQVAPFRQARVS